MEHSDQEEFEPQQVHTSGRKKSNRSPPYALFNLLVIITAIVYGAYYQMYLKDAPETTEATGGGGVEQNDDDLVKIPMYTAEELKKYNGEGECNFFYTLS
jgi:hypothetical protein